MEQKKHQMQESAENQVKESAQKKHLTRLAADEQAAKAAEMKNYEIAEKKANKVLFAHNAGQRAVQQEWAGKAELAYKSSKIRVARADAAIQQTSKNEKGGKVAAEKMVKAAGRAVANTGSEPPDDC